MTEFKGRETLDFMNVLIICHMESHSIAICIELTIYSLVERNWVNKQQM